MEIKIQDDAPQPVQPTLRFLLSHPAHWLSLGFGSGLSPIVPGTVGTLAGWGIYVLLTEQWPEIFTPEIWGVLIVVGFALGAWACGRTGRDIGKADHGAMVWDEIIAFWLVLVVVMPAEWPVQLAAFVLFRAFDMIKPPPIRFFDRTLKNGFGVMWDDIVAAFYALLVLALWRVFAG